MRAAGDLGAHERGLGVEAVGIDALEIVAPGIVVAVARGGGEVRRVDAVFLHRADDLALVVFCDAVDLVKARAQTGEDLLAEAVHRRRDAERGVHGLCIHRSSPYYDSSDSSKILAATSRMTSGRVTTMPRVSSPSTSSVSPG